MSVFLNFLNTKSSISSASSSGGLTIPSGMFPSPLSADVSRPRQRNRTSSVVGMGLFKIKDMRVINDPQGHTHSPASSDHYSHLKVNCLWGQTYGQLEGRTYRQHVQK